jgi:hypothetical protein
MNDVMFQEFSDQGSGQCCLHQVCQPIACQHTLQRTPYGVPLSSSAMFRLSRSSCGWISMVSSISKENFSKLLRCSHVEHEAYMNAHHHDWFLWVSYLSLYVIDDVRQCCPCGMQHMCGQIGKLRPHGVVCYYALLKTCSQQVGVVRGVDLFCNGVLRHGLVPMKYKNSADLYVPFLVVDANVNSMFELFHARCGEEYAAKVKSLHWFFGHALPFHVFPIDEDSKVDSSAPVCTSNETLASWSEVLGIVYSDQIMDMINANRTNNDEVKNLCADSKSQQSIRLVGDGEERKLSMHHHLRIRSSRYACTPGGVCFALDGSLGNAMSRSLVHRVQQMDVSETSVLHGYQQRFGMQINGKHVGAGVDESVFNHSASLRCTREISTTTCKQLFDVNQIDGPLDLCPVYSPPRAMVCVLGDCATLKTRQMFGRSGKRARIATSGHDNEVEVCAKAVLQALLGEHSKEYITGVFSVIDSFVNKDFHFFVVRLPNLPVRCADHAKAKKCQHAEQHYALRFHGDHKNLTWRLVCWDNQCKMSQLNWAKTKQSDNNAWQNLIGYVPSGVIDRTTCVVEVRVNAVVS